MTQPLTPSSLTTPFVQYTPTPHSLPHPGLQALRAKIGLGPPTGRDQPIARSETRAYQEHLQLVRDLGWQVQQAAGQGQEEGKSTTLQQEEDMHMLQQQEAGKHTLQGGSTGRPGLSLVQARAQLSKLNTSSITVGEVKLMLQDYQLLAQERSRSALQEAAAMEGNRPRHAQDVLRILTEGIRGPSPMSFAHLAGYENELRVGEVPALMAEYKTAVALQ
eukprot:scaffold102162_cov17-Tisochrysis_lutea.AAC.1